MGTSGHPESCTPPSFTSHSLPFTEELQKLLLEQMELRKKLEREFQSLKGTPILTHLTSSPLHLIVRSYFTHARPRSGTPSAGG